MKFLIRRWKCIGISGMILLTLCCLAFSTYKYIVWNERDECFARLAKEYNVDPTFISIGRAVQEQLQPELKYGMGQSETHSVLSRIAPIQTSSLGRSIDGGLVELIYIKVCRYPENNLTYMITYSNEGTFQEIRLYWDD